MPSQCLVWTVSCSKYPIFTWFYYREFYTPHTEFRQVGKYHWLLKSLETNSVFTMLKLIMCIYYLKNTTTYLHFDITCHSGFQEEVNCNTDLSVKAAVKFQKRIAELTVAVAAAHHNYLPTPYFPNILVALTMTCFAMQQRQAKKKNLCESGIW